MKANEIMIGDLVLLFGETPARVDAIGDTEVYVYEKERGDWHVGYEYIKPIPITSEILEKNGFSTTKKFRTYYYQKSGVYISVGMWGRITVSSEGNRMNIDCQYIHELQHALRICGIEKEIIL